MGPFQRVSPLPSFTHGVTPGPHSTDRIIWIFADASPSNPRHHLGGTIDPDTDMWPGDFEEADVLLVDPARPTTQASGPNWAAPPPPSFPGMTTRLISTPSRLTGPPANSPLPNQGNPPLTGAAFAPGARLIEQAAPSRAISLAAAFSRFGCILGLPVTDIELGQRLLSDVSRPDSATPQLD